MYDKYNVISMMLACSLHLIIFAAMILAFNESDANIPNRPLMIEASLINENNLVTPQKKREQERKVAEEKKRLADVENERIRIEKNKKQALDDKRKVEQKLLQDQKIAEEKEKKEAQAKLKKEQELEKQRIEAEKERQEDIRRQRAANEKKRKELEEAEKQAQLDRELENEQKRIDALRSGALTRYTFALGRKIENNWIQPATADKGISCIVSVRQLPGGEVISVIVERCNGDETVRRSVEAAVYKASPLPDPEDPALFERNLRFIFEPYQ
tara:strand:+ start:2835 stop:3647 length:813 start_codon:yes stop_codon:yes gene_type:complete